MSSLGPEARALIRAGRDALQPTVADRSRTTAGLHARLAGTGAATAGGAAAAVVTKSRVLLWSGVSAAVVGLGAGGLWLAGAFTPAEAPARAPAPAVTLTAPAPAVTGAPPTVPDGANLAPVERPAAQAPVAVGAAPAAGQPRKRTNDGLGEEVELLSRAQTDLRAGRFANALRLLDEHARKFPRGTLAQERRATRIQALCGSGRVADGDAELARLSPGSVHERRAREACAAARKAGQ